MKKNIGSVDQIIRFVLGAVILVFAFVNSSIILAIIAAIPILTALLKWCPLYCPLNISTCGSDKCDS